MGVDYEPMKPESRGEPLARAETSQSVTLTMEQFEKLYLTPANKVSGDLRRTFANPTPLPLLGFLIASTPLAAALMGWRGAGGGGAATIGTYYFFGGLLQIIGSLLEWVFGNTFVYIVFTRRVPSVRGQAQFAPRRDGATDLFSLGAFWLAFAATLTPFFNAETAFTASAITAAEKAAGLASFEASLAFFLVFMGVLVLMYLVCSLRTNIVFFLIFLFLDVALWLLAGAYFKAAEGDAVTFVQLEVASGACVFVFCVLGWYLLFAQLLVAVEFPLNLPVGDLSTRILRKSKKPAADAV
ncbi:hypothetical protein LTR74_012871 [Friedmanniomyces endolithicus]|nr:hypothetical protein LTR74_012871 [Friedmanniomyces endolithicus]